jgi:hypothetical protein
MANAPHWLHPLDAHLLYDSAARGALSRSPGSPPPPSPIVHSDCARDRDHASVSDPRNGNFLLRRLAGLRICEASRSHQFLRPVVVRRRQIGSTGPHPRDASTATVLCRPSRCLARRHVRRYETACESPISLPGPTRSWPRHRRLLHRRGRSLDILFSIRTTPLSATQRPAT